LNADFTPNQVDFQRSYDELNSLESRIASSLLKALLQTQDKLHADHVLTALRSGALIPSPASFYEQALAEVISTGATATASEAAKHGLNVMKSLL
jgi:hypothetical protein